MPVRSGTRVYLGMIFSAPRRPIFLSSSRQRVELVEAREVAATPQLRNAQLDRPGTGFPIAVAIPITVRQALGTAFAARRAGQALDFQLHQPMRREPIISLSRSARRSFPAACEATRR